MMESPGRFWGLGLVLVLQSIGVLRWFRVACTAPIAQRER